MPENSPAIISSKITPRAFFIFLSIKEIGYGLTISNSLKIKKLENKTNNVLSKNTIKIRYPITSSITILLSSISLKTCFLYD